MIGPQRAAAPRFTDLLQPLNRRRVYGYAAGTTIGHELTHGFDDQGRQFDERGNLQDWWTEEDAAEFMKRAQGVVKQFNHYVAVGTTHVNGSATQGENIADLGGITIAWDAFKKTEQYKSGKSTGCFTPAQRYFIGWALGWMNQIGRRISLSA